MTPRILVVDDSLTIRRALEMILKDRDLDLRTAATGQEGLEEAARFDPDLILLDYVLPDMRGPDVCAALEEIAVTRHTPVVLVSAKGASIRQAYQDARNVVSYITKPFKPAVVLTVVDNVLRDHPRREQTPAADTAPKPSPPGRLDSIESGFRTLLLQLEDAAGSFRGDTDSRGPDRASLLGTAAALTADLAATRETPGSPLSVSSDGTILEIRERLLQAHRALAEAILRLAGAPDDAMHRPPPALLLVTAGAAWPSAEQEHEWPREVWTIADDDPMLPHLVACLRPPRVLCVDDPDAAEETDPRQAEWRERCAPHTAIEVVSAPVDPSAQMETLANPHGAAAEEDWEVVCL